MTDVRLPEERQLSHIHFVATARELRRLPRRRRSRWGMTVALAGALVMLSAAAAVGYGLITPQERFEDVGCYDQPSLEGSVTVVAPTERDPAEACRELWADGVVAGPEVMVPPDDLTACVMPNDAAVGVFPGDDAICDSLGLQALRDVEVRPGDVSVSRLKAAVHERVPGAVAFSGEECLDTAEVRRRAEQALDDVGARAWSVTWEGDEADGDATCGVLSSFDVAARAVVLGGAPGPQSAEARVSRQRVRVSRQLSETVDGACIGDRDQARALAEQALRDAGMTDWTVEVADGSWDANAVQPHGGEQCAQFDLEPPRTIIVSSHIREPETGWRRFVPGM